ncbi:GTP 3',8-cyclase MoaA [Acinetobacter bohemicus]|jgi:cyclic pyranopterin phosphate synthase|uniref:GTP 3',8-cyclase n=1 Tax=Acinetobacter bohemicus TaxID=1435036 RepID=A0A1I6NPX1_9GAMM|nr:GTP 3',8-cyclase MoaA [Acinetobacter bohemicus]KAB0654958.1 GTP 3',8-cyclase MoaA [Acinetobacter bohemicus]SFS29943.1 cyclic pyranopterin phosphate synthase [Acinetobacter bohemicus]
MNMMTELKSNALFVDQFGRGKRKLRISVTDRCNFKCVYCMPEHPEWMKKHDLLSFEELYQFCDFMVRRGIEFIRITGGEPLMRQGVVHFVAQLQNLKQLGLKRISMTSNAHYLKQYAQALKYAGLDDLNISLDSLDATQFKQLTQKDLAPVLDGIRAAQAVGLPIKINSVLMSGINDNQILPLARWSVQQKVILRFIEFMPLDGDRKWSTEHVVSEQHILETLATEFAVTTQAHDSTQVTSNPARQYLINNHPIGIISTITNSFCGTCDRVRLTAQGEFYNCLFAPQGLNLKAEIKALASSEPLSEVSLNGALSGYIWNKEQGFHAIEQRLNNQSLAKSSRKISMHMLGG